MLSDEHELGIRWLRTVDCGECGWNHSHRPGVEFRQKVAEGRQARACVAACRVENRFVHLDVAQQHPEHRIQLLDLALHAHLPRPSRQSVIDRSKLPLEHVEKVHRPELRLGLRPPVGRPGSEQLAQALDIYRGVLCVTPTGRGEDAHRGPACRGDKVGTRARSQQVSEERRMQRRASIHQGRLACDVLRIDGCAGVEQQPSDLDGSKRGWIVTHACQHERRHAARIAKDRVRAKQEELLHGGRAESARSLHQRGSRGRGPIAP
mmetsp:Transcript_483/g.1668  ORF Transcript_483/g.1668 Transcript_483/m.1668 type:complete len:264 (-) Transcript_483:1684-2475(-)|eukprot:scaffold33789_cov101-Isochrysis_galbana.AAC.3